jgi:hypothetical protein
MEPDRVETAERLEYSVEQAAAWLAAHGLPMSSRTLHRRMDTGEVESWRVGTHRRTSLAILERYRARYVLGGGGAQ